MSEKKKELCKVARQEKIGSDVYSLYIQTEKIARQATAGQFVALYSKDGSRLLPRPISICRILKDKGQLRLVYRVVGKGTDEFSHLMEGDEIEVMGPLGNGFPVKEVQGKRVMLMGGGIGVPPMLETAAELGSQTVMVAGYRDELFLEQEFTATCDFHIATEDGSVGIRGNVLDAVREKNLKADVIFACGPMPMLRAIKAYALDQDITCYISMEEKMACGIGACLACVCKSTEVDGHSHVHNKRICKDGPVFLSTEVEL